MELYCLSRAPPPLLARPRPIPRARPFLSPYETPLHHSNSGLHCTRATSPEESFTTIPQKFEDPSPPASKKGVEVEVFSVEETAAGGEQSHTGDFLNNLDVKVAFGDTYSILFFGAGALLALWISSAVVSSIDSIPLFPKLMEVIGLGYTIWFSYRFLIFKKNREELFSKIEDLKEQILGLSDVE